MLFYEFDMSNSNTININFLLPPGKFIFYLILIILPIFIFCTFELCLRLFHYGQDYSLFISPPDPAFRDFKIVNPEIGAKYFQDHEYSRPVNDIFRKNKDNNCFRIFVMGSSTVVGFPYEPNLMFPRILQSRLQSAYPEMRIEIINTAITAINSFTLFDFTDDILAEKPDAILIYAGHNEYYGAFGVGSNEGVGKSRSIVLLHMKLLNLKFYQLIRHTIYKLRTTGESSSQFKKRGTLMTRIVKNADIVYGSNEYNAGLNHYQANMSAILQKASKNKVPVFISTLVSNIRDIKPFGSIKSGQEESADEIYTKARQHFDKGEFIPAKELYTRARDLDCVRFRASSDINNSIEELAAKYHCYLVPMVQAFEKKSPDSIVGNNLFTEHVHPNISGYFLMADVFYTSITESKLIANETNKFTTRSETSFQNSYGYTDLDSLQGYHMIENLKYHWPFRDETTTYLDYRLIYKPVDLIDSIAFSHLVNKNSIPVVSHQNLAKKFIERNEPIKAYREYKAIVQIAPSTPKFLREAASYFITAGDLPLALKYFEQSLEYEQSYFAGFRAGEICMIQNDFSHASKLFTKAFDFADNETKPKILNKLYQCYIYSGRQTEARQVYEIINQYSPGLRVMVPPKTYSFSNYLPIDIKDQVEKAREYLKDKMTKHALELLIAALEINDSPVVNRMIGNIYYEMQDFNNAVFFMEKAFPWFKFEPLFLDEIIRINMAGKNFFRAKNCLEQLKHIEPSYPGISLLEKMVMDGS